MISKFKIYDFFYKTDLTQTNIKKENYWIEDENKIKSVSFNNSNQNQTKKSKKLNGSEIAFLVFGFIFLLIPLYCFIEQVLYWDKVVKTNFTPASTPDNVVISIIISLAFLLFWWLFLKLPFKITADKRAYKKDPNSPNGYITTTKIEHQKGLNIFIWLIFIFDLINIIVWCGLGFLNLFSILGEREQQSKLVEIILGIGCVLGVLAGFSSCLRISFIMYR